MKISLFLSLFLTVSILAVAQTPAPPTSPAPGNVAISTPQPPRKISNNNDPVPVKPAASQSSAYTRPDSKTRLKRYVKSMFGPVALGKSVVSAGYSTWRNSPEEWGPTWEGLGRRLASGVGKNVIKQTTTFGLDEAFKLDSAFYRSEKKSFGGRLGDALSSTFVARRPDGKKVFGFPRVAGTYTASIIAAETWYPKRFGYKDGLKSGTISLGLNAAFNVVKEFFLKK